MPRSTRNVRSFLAPVLVPVLCVFFAVHHRFLNVLCAHHDISLLQRHRLRSSALSSLRRISFTGSLKADDAVHPCAAPSHTHTLCVGRGFAYFAYPFGFVCTSDPQLVGAASVTPPPLYFPLAVRSF
jgi:hypothetical protein